MIDDPHEVKGARPPPIDTETSQSDGSAPGRHSDIFFAAVETTRMPMLVTDPRRPDNPIIFCNRAFSQMTGYRLDEIIGSNCRFLQGTDTDRATIDEVRAAIADRREIAVEVLNYRKDGSTFWNALFVSPVYNRDGELVYFFGSQLDVSRRKDAEDGLRQAQKMEALGQLTGGIAHDFNNLLQIILGYTDIIRGSLSQQSDIASDRMVRAADNVRNAADRAKTLTSQLLAFARKQRLEGRVTNLNTLVEGMIGLADRTLGDHVDVEHQLERALWNARVDPSQAELAILNILINARDAMPDGGKVVIETKNQEITPDDRLSFSDLTPGRYASIGISDTGSGIAPDILSRVMDPFFTTKEEGKGTGLGLSMVYGFVKQSGGAVDIKSDQGSGTTIRLLFPAVDERAPPPGARPARGPAARGRNERILVVDDRAEVADLAEDILTAAGYLVVKAHNGHRALEVLVEEQCDLLFTDLIMPGGMNGVVLAREARRRVPGLKVLLTTGYAENSLERRDVGGIGFDTLDKPYSADALLRSVRQALKGPTGIS